MPVCLVHKLHCHLKYMVRSIRQHLGKLRISIKTDNATLWVYFHSADVFLKAFGFLIKILLVIYSLHLSL